MCFHCASAAAECGYLYHGSGAALAPLPFLRFFTRFRRFGGTTQLGSLLGMAESFCFFSSCSMRPKRVIFGKDWPLRRGTTPMTTSTGSRGRRLVRRACLAPRRLSIREKDVLALVAKGLTNKEVAGTLGLSQFTVRNHLMHIMEKLEATDRTEAIFIAIQTGLITLP